MAKSTVTPQQQAALESEIESFTEAELDHFIAVSCMQQRQAVADLKVYKEMYNDIIKAEEETRERFMAHLKARHEADTIVTNGLVNTSDANAAPTLAAVK